MADASALPHLQRLNPEQYRAVTTIEGPLLILAGAGSGKTRVLTRRIAHMLHLGVTPETVLAVTFTNKAASEMKHRVQELVGEAGKKVWVSTFHSTCCRILRNDIEALGYTRRFAIYDDDDQLRILRDLVAQSGLDPLRTPANAIRGQIDHYKNRMLTVDEVVRQRRTHVNDPLVRIWREYDEALKAADALDFNDLIGTTARLFQEHPAVLAKWREKFRYVMVDEYQDTNRGQYELLRLLVAEHRNIAVVGDDDQSIYGFRGADISIIRSFQTDWPDATVARLEQNYRSTSNILALANAVVSASPDRIEKRLWTEASGGARIRMYSAESVHDEARWVARAIGQLRRQSYEYGQIAVIYRTNATSRAFEQALRNDRIPHRIVGGRKFYERREVRDLLAYLRLIVNPADDAAFLRVVNVPTRGVGAKTLASLREDAVQRGQPLLDTSRSRSPNNAANKGLLAFVEIVDALAKRAREVDPEALVSEAIERSGYLAMLQSELVGEKITTEAQGRIENLEALVQDAHAFVAPADAFTPIDRLTAWLDRIALSADSDEIPDGGEVTLMTVHSSKGLEYPVVFVAQMNEGQFPHAKSEEVGVDEERRLAYVAFTRAMKLLVITRSRTNQRMEGGHRETTSAMPSRFLFGIPLEVCEGDLPEPEPGNARPAITTQEVAKDKLQGFLRHRTAPIPTVPTPPAWRPPARPEPEPEPEPEVPTGTRILREIEDLSDLRKGTRIQHAAHGMAEIRALRGSQVLLAFADGRQRWLQVDGEQMQIVVERDP